MKEEENFRKKKKFNKRHNRMSLTKPLLDDDGGGGGMASADYSALGRDLEKLGRNLNVITTLGKRIGTHRDTHSLREELNEKRKVSMLSGVTLP